MPDLTKSDQAEMLGAAQSVTPPHSALLLLRNCAEWANRPEQGAAIFIMSCPLSEHHWLLLVPYDLSHALPLPDLGTDDIKIHEFFCSSLAGHSYLCQFVPLSSPRGKAPSFATCRTLSFGLCARSYSLALLLSPPPRSLSPLPLSPTSYHHLLCFSQTAL